MQGKRQLIHVMHSDALVAAGIGALLREHAEFEVAAHSGSTDLPGGPDVVVCDHAAALALARTRAATGGALPRILIVTHHDKEAHVRDALDLGVYGYLLQDCSADELHDAVKKLGAGVRYLTERVSKSIADSITRTMLTRRESDVLNLLAIGHCNKLIARDLGIGVGTVKTHIKGLLTKLEAKARTHAVVIAAQRGLVDPSVGGITPGRTARQGMLAHA